LLNYLAFGEPWFRQEARRHFPVDGWHQKIGIGRFSAPFVPQFLSSNLSLV
jgi:hypothetical protein